MAGPVHGPDQGCMDNLWLASQQGSVLQVLVLLRDLHLFPFAARRESLSSALWVAVWNDHADVVQHLLRAGRELCVETNGRCAACDGGHHQSQDGAQNEIQGGGQREPRNGCEYGLCLDFANNTRDTSGGFFAYDRPVCLLTAAAWHHSAGAVVELLSAKASAAGNADEDFPETPLFSALGRGGNLAIVAALCGAKADINVQRHSEGHTPLIDALYQFRNHRHDLTKLHNLNKLVEGLICLKADVNQAIGRYRVPVNLAAQNTPEMLRAVLSAKADPNESRADRERPLFYAVDAPNQGHELVEILLLAKACVETEGDDTTALSQCMNRGQRGCRVDIARALLRAKADVNRRDMSGRTPLLKVVAANKLHKFVAPTVVELLRAKADVDTCDDSHQTPLVMATRRGRIKCVQLLVSAKCDVNKTGGKHELAPLHAAAQRGNIKIAAFLIARGADVHAASRGGRTPMAYGTSSAMHELLKSAGAKIADESL